LVVQKGEVIFSMDASFQRRESGREHQLPNLRADLQPPPAEKIPAYLFDSAFITWRHDFRKLQAQTPQPPEQYVWFKSNGPVPDDEVLQTCLLVYESDNTLIGTSRLPHRGHFDRDKMQVASLDHAMWFHHPADVSQWLLYAQDSPSTSSGRGISRGSIYDLSGRLVASTVQEGLIRVHDN
ncbi:MAG: acyl-CoA thioesterase II, partial [Pseudomonadota bacterium]